MLHKQLITAAPTPKNTWEIYASSHVVSRPNALPQNHQTPWKTPENHPPFPRPGTSTIQVM